MQIWSTGLGVHRTEFYFYHTGATWGHVTDPLWASASLYVQQELDHKTTVVLPYSKIYGSRPPFPGIHALITIPLLVPKPQISITDLDL